MMISRWPTSSVKFKTKWERRYAQQTSVYYSNFTSRRCWQCPEWSSVIIKSNWHVIKSRSSSVYSLTNLLKSLNLVSNLGREFVTQMDCMRAGKVLKKWIPLLWKESQETLKNSLMKIIVWGKSGFHGSTINYSQNFFRLSRSYPRLKWMYIYYILYFRIGNGIAASQ